VRPFRDVRLHELPSSARTDVSLSQSVCCGGRASSFHHSINVVTELLPCAILSDTNINNIGEKTEMMKTTVYQNALRLLRRSCLPNASCLHHAKAALYHVRNGRNFSSHSSPPPEWEGILEQVAAGKISPTDAMKQMSMGQSNAQVLESFANLDHTRQRRTGFPEAVFAEGKTPLQVAAILDDMAKNADPESTCAILATR